MGSTVRFWVSGSCVDYAVDFRQFDSAKAIDISALLLLSLPRSCLYQVETHLGLLPKESLIDNMSELDHPSEPAPAPLNRSIAETLALTQLYSLQRLVYAKGSAKSALIHVSALQHFNPELRVRRSVVACVFKARAPTPHNLYYEVHGAATDVQHRVAFIMGLNSSSFGWIEQVSGRTPRHSSKGAFL